MCVFFLLWLLSVISEGVGYVGFQSGNQSVDESLVTDLCEIKDSQKPPQLRLPRLGDGDVEFLVEMLLLLRRRKNFTCKTACGCLSYRNCCWVR